MDASESYVSDYIWRSVYYVVMSKQFCDLLQLWLCYWLITRTVPILVIYLNIIYIIMCKWVFSFLSLFLIMDESNNYLSGKDFYDRC